MSSLLRTITPVAVFAAALAAALATMTGAGDATLHATGPAPVTPAAATATEQLFIAERFEAQKREASSEELPPQF